MASLVAPSPTSFLHPTLQPRQGILLNRNDVSPLTTPRRSPIDLPAPLPRNNSNYSSNSNSSDSSSPSNSPPRKIRFAPLPDPRRVVPETGDTTETQDAAAAASLAPSSATAGELIALTPVASTSGESTVNGDDSEPRTESSTYLRPNSKKKKSKKWGKRLFGPLLKGGAKLDGLAPLCDSCQSNASSAHEVGFPLGRRKSTGSTDRPRGSLIGAPLTLTRSAEGEGGVTAPVRQQRMLNGRVYGARQTLPTTTQEPVFVEWGFGGTGAVASGGSQYARLQSSNKLSLGTEATTADEDDGSGMAWVAKRRAAREEKARKEKEAALEAERAQQVCPCTLYSCCSMQISCHLQAAEAKEEDPATTKIISEVNSQQFGDGETRPQTPTPASDKSPSAIPPSPSRQFTEGRDSDVTTPPPPSLTSDHEEHHTVKTISIPGAHPRPHHDRNQSIASPKEHAATYPSPPSSERESEHGSTTEDDDEDSETELEEDIEEVCPYLNLTNLYAGPDIVPAGGEKDSALRWYGEGIPPYLTLLFGLPTCGRFRFSTIIGRACLVFALAHLCPPTYTVFLLPYRTHKSLHYSLSHDIRAPQVYPILLYDTLLTPSYVLTSLHPHPIVCDWTAALH